MRASRIAALTLALVASVAVAGRPLSETTLLVQLNGVPVKLGTLTSTGTSVSNSTTAVPFTIAGGSVLEVVCDGAAVVTVGSTAAAGDYTSASMGTPMATGASRWFVLRDSDTALALDTTGTTVNCAVFVMR